MTTCPMSGTCCQVNWGKLSLRKLHLDLGVIVNIQHTFTDINCNNSQYFMYLTKLSSVIHAVAF